MCLIHRDTAKFYPAISTNTIWKSSTDGSYAEYLLSRNYVSAWQI